MCVCAPLRKPAFIFRFFFSFYLFQLVRKEGEDGNSNHHHHHSPPQLNNRHRHQLPIPTLSPQKNPTKFHPQNRWLSYQLPPKPPKATNALMKPKYRTQPTLTTSRATSTLHTSQTTSRSTTSGTSSSSTATTVNSETETVVVVAKGRATWGADITSAARGRRRRSRKRSRSRFRVGVGVVMWVLWLWWRG